MTWLGELPSGAWVLIGTLVAGSVSFFGLWWQERAGSRRDAAAREAFVADRTRNERRVAYEAVLLATQKANSAINRYFNESQFEFDPRNTPGIEYYDKIWEQFTGDFGERAAIAHLVASDAVRVQLDEVSTYFHDSVFAMVEEGRRPAPSEHPVQLLEGLLAVELGYRGNISRGSD